MEVPLEDSQTLFGFERDAQIVEVCPIKTFQQLTFFENVCGIKSEDGIDYLLHASIFINKTKTK